MKLKLVDIGLGVYLSVFIVGTEDGNYCQPLSPRVPGGPISKQRLGPQLSPMSPRSHGRSSRRRSSRSRTRRRRRSRGESLSPSNCRVCMVLQGSQLQSDQTS